MQPRSIRMKLRDQPFDAFDLRRVSRRTQQLAVALNPLVYFYARLAHKVPGAGGVTAFVRAVHQFALGAEVSSVAVSAVTRSALEASARLLPG
jgi:hypothetical protein